MCLAELGREGQLLSHFFGPQVESSRARVSPLPHSYFSRCQLAVFQENKGRKLAGAGRHGGGGGAGPAIWPIYFWTQKAY